MKYIKQKQATTCGPVGVLNVLKWLGRNVSEKSHGKKIKKMCRWVRGIGTGSQDINTAFQKANVPIEKIKAITTFEEMNSHLENEGSIFICYFRKGEKNGVIPHCTFCIGKTKNYYILVNDIFGRTLIKRSKKTVEKMMESRWQLFDGIIFPTFWFINKEKTNENN